MLVFLTGATGFVGSYVLKALLDEGHTVRCLVRDADKALSLQSDRVKTVKGDILNPKSFVGTIRGCDAVIHLVGIIEEHPSKGITFDKIHYQGTKNVVDEAVEAGVPRFVQMSANGARKDGVSAYQTSKWKAEKYVKEAGFAHGTIIRPSIVFGDPGPDNIEFATRLAKELIAPFPILPVFGDGKYELQPISVEEVAATFVQSLVGDTTRNKTYCVAGKEAYPFTEILDRITRGMGKEPKPKIKQPIWLARPLIHGADKLGALPISPDQFEMLIEGNTCKEAAFYRDFEVAFKPFTPENLSYLKQRV